MTYFNKFNQKVSDAKWHMDDPWLYTCWGHMCNSTQASLWTSPMEIHQSTMYVDTILIFLKILTKVNST